jgi:hypothetical protein
MPAPTGTVKASGRGPSSRWGAAIFNEEYVTTQLGIWYAGVTVAGLVAVGLLLVSGVVAARGRSRPGEAVPAV